MDHCLDDHQQKSDLKIGKKKRVLKISFCITSVINKKHTT